ncbi:hypothetical protein ILUMI_16240 [Ignelater luminosus]|uniref:SCAN domain-containing protein n=1 Tax=Ignelater luminosus TaxID=2038154 RepID=A0A8K0G953_IGNLU|nr:hypothetical protein ILUMI_16240 [Ignelater luminosus]
MELLKIFLEVGCPHTLQSDNGCCNTRINNIQNANGRPRHPTSQASVERSKQDVEAMLRAWLIDNDTKDWAIFIQFQKSSSFHQDLDRFVKQQHNDNTSTSEDLPAAALINNNASTSEEPALTGRTPVLLVESKGEAVDKEGKAFCVVCRMKFTGAHLCDICKNLVHAICGNTVGEEGYGWKILCYVCQKRRKFKRTKQTCCTKPKKIC